MARDRAAGVRENPHLVNLAVLLVSAAAAAVAPLETFILAYAVLGPFHYLTEIAWLRKKQFFLTDGIVSPRWYVLLSVALGTVASLDLLYKRGWGTYAIGLLIVLSLGALVRNVPILLGALVLAFVTKFFVHGYGLFLAAFVPTILHVFVFTLIFLVSGAMRARTGKAFGWFNAAMMLALPLLLVRFSGLLGGGTPGSYWMRSEGAFAEVHQYLGGMLGLAMHFNATAALEPNAIALFRFLAFIYLHHYLNWFAKTELLEWHRVSRHSWAAIVVLYAGMLGSYAYSVAVGFYAAYFLSLLHVLLEFPLDWRGLAGVFGAPVKRVGTWRKNRRVTVGAPL